MSNEFCINKWRVIKEMIIAKKGQIIGLGNLYPEVNKLEECLGCNCKEVSCDDCLISKGYIMKLPKEHESECCACSLGGIKCDCWDVYKSADIYINKENKIMYKKINSMNNKNLLFRCEGQGFLIISNEKLNKKFNIITKEEYYEITREAN